MGNLLALMLFVSALTLNLYSLIFFVELGDSMKNSGKEKEEEFEEVAVFAGFEFCFFTLWNFIFQLVFMIVAIMDEAAKLMKLPISTQNKLSKTRAVMFNTVLFPSTLVVVSIFWTLWHIDRELVFPKVLDLFFPQWLNHMLHTFILLPVIIEIMLPKKHNFVKFQKAAPALALLFLSYTILYFSLYFRHGVWLYPVYKVLTWPQRLLFSAAQLCGALGYQKLGIVLQNSKRSQNKQKVK
ncbi:androgen-dependent TFPI-regulating protein isoform X2 [Diabrotica virgifera virgifera]|uniref:Androgen-dependent TFPI-regulating protein-like isoform X4 n=1 Tax=Diabrotica virgifera virgifera TaxID=50390 RepID=A0A6P7F732_DIAVI|nr:androgen-dependent TFPI-regulating protein isoform X2 [Diabrotica virgifera virgifera]